MDESTVVTRALELKGQYEGLVVKDDASFEAMASFEKTADDNIKAIKAHILPQKDEANRRHKKITLKEKEMIAPWEEVKKGARQKRLTYAAEQKAIADKKRMEAEKEARAKAEAERLEQAKALEESGQHAEAEAAIEAPITPVAPPPPEDAPVSVKGAREVWSCEIFDPSALFKAIAEGVCTVPAMGEKELEHLDKALGLSAQAKRMKAAFNVPGCKAQMRQS